MAFDWDQEEKVLSCRAFSSIISRALAMKRHHSTIIIVALCVAVMAVVYFIVLYRLSYRPDGKIGKEKGLTIEYTNQIIDMDVSSGIWKKIRPATIHLVPQSARVAYGNDEKDILVRGIFNDEEVAFLLEIYDESEDLGGLINPDACAVLLAPEEIPATAQMMGYESKVNIWHWSADRNAGRYDKIDQSVNVVRELVAEGPATQKPLAGQYVIGKGVYEPTRWRVIFKRKLAGRQMDAIDITPGTRMNIAFAVWDGSKTETFSRKSISILMPLIIGKK